MLSVMIPKKSKTLYLRIVISPNTPKESALGIPTRKIALPIITVALRRDHLSVSIANETGTSRSAIALVTAAKNTRAKKRNAKIGPPLISENTIGNVPKISPGPCFGSSWNENTAGKIAIPAKIAIAVSSPATERQLFGIFSFSLR